MPLLALFRKNPVVEPPAPTPEPRTVKGMLTRFGVHYADEYRVGFALKLQNDTRIHRMIVYHTVEDTIPLGLLGPGDAIEVSGTPKDGNIRDLVDCTFRFRVDGETFSLDGVRFQTMD